MPSTFRVLTMALACVIGGLGCGGPKEAPSNRVGAKLEDYDREQRIEWINLYSDAKAFLLAIDHAQRSVEYNRFRWNQYDQLSPRMEALSPGSSIAIRPPMPDWPDIITKIVEARLKFKVSLMRFETNVHRIEYKARKDLNTVDSYVAERQAIRNKQMGDDESELAIDLALQLLSHTNEIVLSVISEDPKSDELLAGFTALAFD